jgi:hypothetical protein
MLLCSTGGGGADRWVGVARKLARHPRRSSPTRADSYTAHWTLVFGPQGYKAISSLAVVDGVGYRLLGPPCGGTPALPQLGYARVYPTTTLYRYVGAGVAVNLTFTTPRNDGHARGRALPIVYVSWDVASADGQPHNVSLYFDVTAQLAVNVDSQLVQWERTNLSTGAAGFRIGTAGQALWDGFGDDFRIDWGWAHLATAAAGATLSAASSNWMRYTFLRYGIAGGGPLLPPPETVMPVQACNNTGGAGAAICSCQIPGGTGAGNDWPALGVAWDLGTITPSSPATRFAVAGYDDVYAARFFGQPQVALWRSSGRTMEQLVSDAVAEYEAAMAAAIASDLDIVTRLRAVGIGEAYERMGSLAYRQAFADNKLAWYDGAFGTQPELHQWVKGCDSSGDTGTMDDNLPAVPLFLWREPDLVQAFLAPLMLWATNATFASAAAPFPRNMTYDFAFAPHYLGQHPDAELQCWTYSGTMQYCEPMPIEMSADSLILVAAAAAHTGDYSFALRYWDVLAGWADYLVGNGLYPSVQPSTDDYEGVSANLTHLSAKAIVALGAWSQLCNATGHASEGAASWATAQAFRDAWLTLALDPTTNYTTSMLTYGQPGSASIKYTWLFDIALGLHLFPQTLIDTECAALQAGVLPYGWVLQRSGAGNTWTNLGWEAWMSAVCGPVVATDVYARMVAFVNATDRRLPLTDWFDAATGHMQGFTARAQVGGVFANVWLADLQRARQQRS